MKSCHLTICSRIWDGWRRNSEHFEAKFGVKSKDFYDAMVRGEMEEFDALDEYRMEFVEWLALSHKTWTSFNEKYRQLVARQPVALQIKANLEFSYA